MQPEHNASRALSASIVVPTLREASNLRALAERVRSAMAGSGIEWELIIVDDDSRDGTEDVVADLARSMPVRVRTRRQLPRDLSRSVLLGFTLARFDRLVVIDADLSHPPEYIPDLLAALDGGCDIAVGSRYVPGGRLDRGWSLWNLLNSRIATLLSRPLTDCHDPMAGFFAVRREALPDPESLDPIGYKIGLELMVRGRLRVAEVPIVFANRDQGSSKTNWRQRANTLRHLGRLYAYRYGGWARAISFGLVGASGLVVDTAFYVGLQALGLDHRAARFLSFWPAVSWNWLLNRRVTFRDRPHQDRASEWARFVGSSLLGLAANFGSYVALTSLWEVFDRYRLAAFALGIAVGSVCNFLISTVYVFREHSGSR